MYRRHSLDEKVEIVRLVLSGYGVRALCRERRLDHQMVDMWVSLYEAHGVAGLLPDSGPKRLSLAEKRSLVRNFLEKGVPLRQLCVAYGVSRSSAKKWVKAVRSNGYGALAERRRSVIDTKMGRLRKKTYEEMTELERLQYENMVLRAENALLKKLKALAEEEEARKRSIWQKPSTD